MVDNTLRYLMIGPVGAGKSLKADLMCIRAPGDPTQYQEAPCSLPEDFINAQLKARLEGIAHIQGSHRVSQGRRPEGAV